MCVSKFTPKVYLENNSVKNFYTAGAKIEVSDSGDAIIYHSILRELDLMNCQNSPALLCCMYELGLLDDDSIQQEVVVTNFKAAVKKVFEPYEMDLLSDVETKDDLAKRQVTVLLIKIYVQSLEGNPDQNVLPQVGSLTFLLFCQITFTTGY